MTTVLSLETAKCSIVKKEASDVYAVPYDAVHKENGESYILIKDGDSTSKVTVTTGMETDYYIEVQGDDLQEGLQVVIPTDKTDSSSDSNKQNSTFGGFGGMGGTPDGSTGNKGDPWWYEWIQGWIRRHGRTGRRSGTIQIEWRISYGDNKESKAAVDSKSSHY